MPAAAPDWVHPFADEIAGGEIDAALARLRARATGHAGTPPAADKRSALAAIRLVRPEPEALLDLVHCCLDHGDDTAIELAIMLLPHGYPAGPNGALLQLRTLAEHGNWEVREFVADALGALLSRHWAEILPVCGEWREQDSANLRRAVVVGAKYAARERKPGRDGPLLDLLQPLLSDRRPYVRRNLGPFTLGGFLSAYPETTWTRLHSWAGSPDETVRWNVAMAMTSAAATRRPRPALALLERLRGDDRRFVQQAVAAADRALARRQTVASAAPDATA